MFECTAGTLRYIELRQVTSIRFCDEIHVAHPGALVGCHYSVHACATGSSISSCLYIYIYIYDCIIICIYAYIMWSKVMPVSHLSAKKTSPNLVCWHVFAFTCHPTCPLVLVSCRSNAIPRYSNYTQVHPYGQPLWVHRFCLCALLNTSSNHLATGDINEL